MSMLYFPKPQPLSPLKTGRWKMEIVPGKPKLEVRYFQVIKGKKKTVKGVELSDSIYYWWFEYLKLSDKFQRLCGESTALESCDEEAYEVWRADYGDRLLADFGNIFEYEGAEGFWHWWRSRGRHLFGIRAMDALDEFATLDDVAEYREEIERGAIKLVALPTTLTRATLQRRLSKLIDSMELSDTGEQKAEYHPFSVKVDAESLCVAHQAYRMRKEGRSNVFIGAYFSFCGEQQREFVRDGRKKGFTFDYSAYANYVKKRELGIEGEDEKQRLEGEAITKGDVVFYMDSDRRTAKKNYLNVKASRLVAKAEDNIRAVEQRRFPVGTPERLVKGKPKVSSET